MATYFFRQIVFLTLLWGALGPTVEGLAMSRFHVLPQSKDSIGIFRDSLDGQMDMSRFLIDYNGFIPLPQLITEPALGNIGLMLAPVFIKPNKYQSDDGYVPPDITAAFVGYTANETWGFGALRVASLPKHHLEYRIGAAYGKVNLDFYRETPRGEERKYGFSFNAGGIFGSLLRQVGNSDLYAGLQYYYLNNELSYNFERDDLSDFVKDIDFKSQLSAIGIDLEFDQRDNMFTPNTGWFISTVYSVNASWSGSDYDFQNLHLILLKYFQTTEKLVSGFRFDSKWQSGSAPFYMQPGIVLRGVPMVRYQGDQTYVVETEQRYDIVPRWSVLAYGGLAKAPTKETSFADAKLVYNYGTGFRYLIARKFKARMGIDVAWSNDDFGWYIVFGSAWNNRN